MWANDHKYRFTGKIMAGHILITQLMAADPDEEDVLELYEDLKEIFDDPFTDNINQAITERGCTYIELPRQDKNRC